MQNAEDTEPETQQCDALQALGIIGILRTMNEDVEDVIIIGIIAHLRRDRSPEEAEKDTLVLLQELINMQLVEVYLVVPLRDGSHLIVKNKDPENTFWTMCDLWVKLAQHH